MITRILLVRMLALLAKTNLDECTYSQLPHDVTAPMFVTLKKNGGHVCIPTQVSGNCKCFPLFLLTDMAVDQR